jgi:hypothetical protein
MDNIANQIAYFIGYNIFWVAGIVIVFIIVRSLLRQKPNKKTPDTVSIENKYTPEVLKQEEQISYIQPQINNISKEIINEPTTSNTSEQSELEKKGRRFNKRQYTVFKVTIILIGLFTLYLALVTKFSNQEKPEPNSPVTLSTNVTQTSSVSNDTIPKSIKTEASNNYIDYPENEFIDNKLQHFSTENKVPDIKISLSLPDSWIVRPPRYTETINSFLAKNGVDNVNYVLSVYTLNVSSLNLTIENLSSKKGLQLLFDEITSIYVNKKLIATSTNDRLGNYNASSILFSNLSNQKAANGKYLASITKAYYIHVQTKVICFMETYSDSPTLSAEKMKEKYLPLSKLILSSFIIDTE